MSATISDPARHSRRESLSSLSSAAKLERNSISQALDQIHYTASHSDTLTAFNDFSSPPLSTSVDESTGPTGSLVQTGLSGLYSRLRGAVEAVKEKAGVAVGSSEHASSELLVAHGRLTPTPSAMTTVTELAAPAFTASSPSSPVTGRPGQQRARASISTLASTIECDSKKTLKASSEISPSSTGAPAALRLTSISHTPLTKATISAAVNPTVAPVNVIARRDVHNGNFKEESQAITGSIDVMSSKSSSVSGQPTRTKGDIESWNLSSETSSIQERLSASAWPTSHTASRVLSGEGLQKLPDEDSREQTAQPPRPSRASTSQSQQNYLIRNVSGKQREREIVQTNRSSELPSTGVHEQQHTATNQIRPSVLQETPKADVTLVEVGSAQNPLQEASLISPRRSEQTASEQMPAKDPSSHNQQKRQAGISLLPGFSLSRASSFDGLESGRQSQLAHPEPKRRQNDINNQNRIEHRKLEGEMRRKNMQDYADGATEQTRGKVLSKDFWMKDENCKECFLCGDTFSTFRRKHHCRTCGQIFDAKCTSLISGDRFGHPGDLRVCNPCKEIISGYEYTDDDESDDEKQSILTFSQQLRHNLSEDGRIGSSPSPKVQTKSSTVDEDLLTTPMMAIPATRTAEIGSNRRSAVLEIDAEEHLSRPGSSRSFKTPLSSRAFTSGHRRRRSRQQHSRTLRGIHEDGAPFHRHSKEDPKSGSRLPAFHNDSIIDPDLAPYMSDDGSSADERMSLSATMSNDMGFSSHADNDKSSVGYVLALAKKGLSKIDALSNSAATLASRESEDGSTPGLRSSFSHGDMRHKALVSSNSMQHHRSPSKVPRTGNILRNFGSALPDVLSGFTGSAEESSPPRTIRSRMTRSASMRGASAPAVELNNASMQHVRRFLRQLLRDSKIPSVDGWERALMPILLQCTDDVNPDVRHGDDMDICHYVKIKRIPGGRPSDTSYVSGVVFSKNVALKSMSRSISHPNIVIITFPLEYNRREQHFMSLGPVIAQEKEYLTNLVNRIVALRPEVLLVQRNVSGLALQYLAQANVATAYNVKPAVLEAVSRCTQTDIISSVDMLVLKPVQVGRSDGFDVKTYVHKDIPSKKKTFIYLSGCSPDLGCTIVLRGEKMGLLAKLKRITEFMVYVVYNLKLETCLMRDEFVLIPSTTAEGTLSHGSGGLLSTELSLKSDDSKLSVKAQETESAEGTFTEIKPSSQPDKPRETLSSSPSADDGDLMPTFYGDMVEKHRTRILSASPFVKFMQPYLLMCARKQESRLAHLKQLRDQVIAQEEISDTKAAAQRFLLIQPEMAHQTVQDAPKKVLEVLHAVHDAEYDKALYNYETQKRQWETYVAGTIDLFDPYAHQNIVILYSLVCTSTTIPCTGPDLVALAYYNEHDAGAEFDPDCALGQFVEDLCLGANTICTANGCEKKMLDHHRSYVHGEARISVFVENHPCKIRGLQDSILMWSYCKVCKKETQVMAMSENSWKYSFGKYLEISFWSSNLRLRAGVCPHDLHRDHIRYFGYKDLALRIHYDSIELLEIIVPRTRVTWNVESDLRLKNDIYEKVERRINRFMASVKARLKGITVDMVIREKTEAFKLDIDKLFKRANEDQVRLTRKLQKRYMDSKYYEVIPLNRALRTLQEKVAEWDNAFAEFEAAFFPSEKDITRLAVAQMKRIFLDREGSVSSVNTIEDETPTVASDAEASENDPMAESDQALPPPSQMSPEQAHNVLTSVVEANTALPKASVDQSLDIQDKGAELEQRSTMSGKLVLECPVHSVSQRDIRHLDLALPEQSLKFERQHQLDLSPVSPLDIKYAHREDMAANQSFKGTAETGDGGRTSVNEFRSPLPDKTSKPSNIPRPVDGFKRLATSPPLLRTRSQPTHYDADENPVGPKRPSETITPPVILDLAGRSRSSSQAVSLDGKRAAEGRVSDSLRGEIPRLNKLPGRSNIPRSVPPRRKSSRVSALAKHFEQLSREFEKERLRERRHRAATTRRSRVQPMISSKPIVEVYQDVHEAVDEREPSDNELSGSIPNQTRESTGLTTTGESDLNHSITPPTTVSQSPVDLFKDVDGQVENVMVQDKPTDVEATVTETEVEGSDSDQSLLDEDQIPLAAEGSEELPHMDIQEGLPKHERSSMMKMLTNFWAERSASGWAPLDYPLGASDHIFLDSDVMIREDEPSSLIAFALSSEDYKNKLLSIRKEGVRPKGEGGDLGFMEKDQRSTVDERVEVESSLLRSTGTHLKYQFQDGSAKMLCKIFYAEQFDAVRRKCGVAERIVESISRCVKWDSKGGKTRSVFLKTLDQRFVLKSLSPIETQAFLRFAPAYFQIMSEALFHELPTVIAKMLGFYRILIKNAATGTEIKWDVLIMENLFYGRTPNRIFDLKGSMRNRKIQSTGKQDEVLLDENMVEFIYESPLFVREHSKKLLRASVWNDTLFLARQNVMDYSLMIAVDESRKELVVGIVDCIRTYTWDKKLESWIKDRGFAGGGKNKPTVTSPKEYKSRFREAMARYVLQAPNCWHQFQIRGPQVEHRLSIPISSNENQAEDKDVFATAGEKLSEAAEVIETAQLI
ncbi:MAG: 1-phosphatidylinositol-3-phosphate 5-kinase [Peltula sp. TS41687]|nr:MAG: 1-phosphatidylinositol-3-phosphate 5-kinase [Peltula sp. TS41687]